MMLRRALAGSGVRPLKLESPGFVKKKPERRLGNCEGIAVFRPRMFPISALDIAVAFLRVA